MSNIQIEKIWNVKPMVFKDEAKQLLYNRGIIDINADQRQIEHFLNPNFETDFHDPELLPDFEKFRKRIAEAVSRKETVGIFADYDADGIPGAAFLYRALRKLGINPVVYIPSREEGYGFSIKGIDFLCDCGCQLIISVDLGIKEFDRAEYIHDKGCELIITDHHIPDENTPNALAVINPKVMKSSYPFKELSGGGVVFKLVQGLSKYYPKQIDDSFLKWNLDLIAISTITDVVPMVDENRLIAKYGLISLSKTRNLGLKKLYDVASIDPLKMSSYIVGFQIGPRINAPGRIAHASKSFELLVSEDEKEAADLAKWLNEKNQDRQTKMDEVEAEAESKVLKHKLDSNNIIIVHGEWPKGVIGPSASHLVEKFHRPVIILSREGDYFSGSSRSISSFNILDGLKKVQKYLEAFGGHKGAAGLRLNKDNLDKFTSEMIKIANTVIKPEDLLPKIDIDLEISPKRITMDLFETFAKLEPFGIGNSRPCLVARGLKIDSFSFVGRDNQHLKLMIDASGDKYEAIYFSAKIDTKLFKNHQPFDIVFSPDINRWNGNEKISLNIIDLRPSNETN